MDVLYELNEKHRSPEEVIRKLAGATASVNGRQQEDDEPAIWLTQRVDGEIKLSLVTLSNPENRVLIWCSASGAGENTGLALGAVSILLAPVLAVVAGFVLGAGWWSLAFAPVAFVLGTTVLKWSIRSGEQNRAPAAERLLRQAAAQIADLFGADAAKVEHCPERDRIEGRARSLRIDVEMMEKSLAKAEQCDQRDDAAGKHVQLQTVLHLIKNSIDPNSDLFRRAGRLVGSTDSDFPRVETSGPTLEEIDAALGAGRIGGEKSAIKGAVEELDDPSGTTRWTATHYDLEYGGNGVSWHDRALICGADGIYERRDGGWHRVVPIDEDGDEAYVSCVSALTRRVGPHYIVAADNGVYDVDVFTGKTRTIYSGDCFWSLGRTDDGTIYAGGDAGLVVIDGGGNAKVEFEGDMFVVAARGSDVFAANSEGILKRDGSEWREIIPGLPESTEARAMAPLGGGRVVIAGFEGGVFYFDGSSWTSHTLENAPALHGIWADESDEIVVVGADGFAARYDGEAWIRMPVGTDALLYCVAVQDGDYIIGTENGIIELRPSEAA